jgi:hypothetical protein
VESELGGTFSYESNGGATFSVEVPTERPAGLLPVPGA